MIRNPAPLAWRLRASSRLALAGLLLPLAASAQLQWSVFNETTTVAAPAATATSGVTVTVPAGERVTLVANNLVPFDLSAAGSEQVAAISFKVSGGLSNIAAGTRAVGFGLFNNNGTATNYSDDSGYFTWLNGRSTGSLIEQRRRIGNGVSPSLLNPTGTAFNNLSTGQASPTPGSLSDGNSYTIQFRLQGRSGSIAFGNTSANTTGGGIVVSGPGLQAITFSNPDAPAATFVFNEIGFMFLNTASAPVTLTINSVTGLNPINPPAVATPPAAISLNPGQAGALNVVATGTPPLAYQWRRDGTNLAGATAATYNIASAAATDGGSYSVVITNAYGTVTSASAAVTVTTAAIPATIANQPGSVTRNVGEDASFSVAAFGTSPIAYQWRKDGVAIAGATGTSLNLTAVNAASAGSYTVVVTAGGGATTVTSGAATLAVNTAPAITTQPASVTTAVGQNVSFTVAATGSPAPSYQWSRNGVAIPGATTSTLTINNVSLAHAGAYTVSLINDVGAITSATAVLAIPSSMVATAVSPANGAGGVNIDTPLSITFDRAPTVGTTGRIRIHKASDDTVVDTIDLGASLKQRTVGTNATLYNFIPVTVTGNTAAIYPRAGILAYGQTYYVTVEQSAILDATGASFTGISDKNAWRFTTKAAGPANATALTVAANGSGDFTTVQGAIDSVPAGNTQRVVITVKKGTYNELVYIGATRPFITVRGEDRAQTIVGYPNNNNLNGTTATRAAFSIAANDSILENITIRNPTPQGGSQAEAVFTGALRVMLNRVNLLSRQDTLLTNTGTAFITDSYIEGNVDFMWGTAAAYYQRCELKALDVGTGNVGFYTQIRNGPTGFGAVYVDCKLTAAEGVAGRVAYFLGRIDPGPGNFPYSQCMYLNCAMGPHIDPAGWRLDNATSSPTVQYWEYQNTDLDGASLDITRRHPSSRQLTDSEAALWRKPAFVLAGWNPQIGATIETSPAPQSAVVGANVRLSVVANGAPPPALQWLKDGTPIAGETSDTLVLANVQLGDAGSYTVSATNSNGTVTSAPAMVAVTRGAFAGTYSGTIGGGGSFALYVRDNGSALLLVSGAGAAGTFAARTASVDASGRIRTTAGAYSVDATISATGAITGSIGPAAGSGITAPSVQLTGTRNAATGVSQSFVGYYQTGANNSAAIASIIVSADGKAYVLAQSGATLAAGNGTVDSTGRVSTSLATAGSGRWEFVANVAAGGVSATGTITPATDAVISLAGAGDSAASAQRFREFSARSVISPTSATAVGFTIIGDAPNSVLVRAVGPTLGDAFAVAGALPNPRLDIYRGGTLIASNTGWTTSPNAAEAAFFAAQVGAFPLRAAAADSALRLTLQPGSYSAVISSGSGATSGTGLVEVYDLTAGAAGQRLVNVSVSGLAGTGLNTLIAGVVVTGTQPKRVLIRGVGPGLSGFGVTGSLARPVLSLYRGNTLVATNTGWGTSPDAAGIAAAAGEARAFALATGSADSAILVNLGASLYTATLASADGTSGTALIEVYELP